MTDQLVETSVVDLHDHERSRLESAIGGLSKDLQGDLNEKGLLTLNELLDKVYYWESIHGEKLSEQDFEVLTVLSMVLGTTKLVLDRSVGVRKSEVAKSTFMESARAQQEIIKTVLGSLGEDGKPKRGVVKSLALVSGIFEDYFNPQNPRLDTSGVEREAGLWQGIQGAMTTAFLFREAGWEVGFPFPEFDVKYDVDLIVVSPVGKAFAVDVTARMPRIIDETGTLSEPFYVQKEGVPQYFPKELAEIVEGSIRINVPPLRHHSSQGFYEDRISGYPDISAIDKFKHLLNS
jgi:hypothetical protein